MQVEEVEVSINHSSTLKDRPVAQSAWDKHKQSEAQYQPSTV